MLSIRQTQLSILKRLKDRPVPNVEIEECIASTAALVLGCTSYMRSQQSIADNVIARVKGYNLKNKPTVVCYTRSTEECRRASKINAGNAQLPELLPTQIYILVKWSESGEEFKRFL